MPAIAVLMHSIARQKSSDFHEILYTAADFFELDKRHVIKNEKVALDRLRVRQNVFLVDKDLPRLCFNKTSFKWLTVPMLREYNTL